MSDSLQRGRRALGLALVLLVAVYAMQLVRPLHLESDSVCYLRVAELAAEGRGFGCPGCDRTHCSILYPPGYPWVLAVLIRSNIATPQAFMLLNFASLAVGLVAAASLWRRTFALGRTAVLGMAALMLLWWPVFRYANNPLSDFLFFALALASVQAATLASERVGWTKFRMLLVSAVLAYAALKVRTIGIAVAPAILWAALVRPGQVGRFREQVVSHRAAVFAGALLLVILGAAAVVYLRHSQYVTVDLRTQYSRGLVATLRDAWGYRLTEWGELAANVPEGKMPGALRPLVPVIGVGFLGVLGWALWRRRRNVGPAEVFTAAVTAIMLIWPFKDPRFWLPVLPLFLGLIAWALIPTLSRSTWRRVLVLIVGWFVAVGLAGQVYNTRISLAGEQFPTRFADAYLGPVYRAAWGLRSALDTVPVDSTALHVLRRFEVRAREH